MRSLRLLKLVGLVMAMIIQTYASFPVIVEAETPDVETIVKGRNCKDLLLSGQNTSGIYTIYPYDCSTEVPLKVFCDMDTDGGGWTVIQRRDDILPREDFLRTWMEYVLGFGNLTGEFWLGLRAIHALTKQSLNEIRFDLEDFREESRWAKYKFFLVHDITEYFQVQVNGYTGDAGDSFGDVNGLYFSARDRDLDHWAGNCAEEYKGGWWYTNCYSSNLNGFYQGGMRSSYADGVSWGEWHGAHYSLKRTEMKIRPAY